jgi:hypothetical protein
MNMQVTWYKTKMVPTDYARTMKRQDAARAKWKARNRADQAKWAAQKAVAVAAMAKS